jgi:hypothetical protein
VASRRLEQSPASDLILRALLRHPGLVLSPAPIRNAARGGEGPKWRVQADAREGVLARGTSANEAGLDQTELQVGWRGHRGEGGAGSCLTHPGAKRNVGPEALIVECETAHVVVVWEGGWCRGQGVSMGSMVCERPVRCASGVGFGALEICRRC